LTILKRLGLNDVGSPVQVGGNDWDEMYDFLNGVNLAGKSANIQTPLTLGNANVTIASLDSIGNVDAPSPTNNQQLIFDSIASSWKAKHHPKLAALTVYWHMWIDEDDGNKIKATNGLITFEHVNDAAKVIKDIFLDMGSTPFIIFVAPGEFVIRSWGESNFRRGNFRIKGAGKGITEFNVSQDTFSVAGHNRVFAFEANATQYTQINLAANAPINSFAVMTDSDTGLTAGCHVMLGSNAVLISAAKTGEHNRVVKVVATGTTPAFRVILEKATRYDYNTTDTAWIRRIDFLEDYGIEDCTIKSNQDLTNVIGFLRSDFAYNRHLKNIHFKDWGVWNGGGFHNCLINAVVVDSLDENLTFEQSPERGHSTGQNAVGYAISDRSGCETLYHINCRFTGLIRHCYTTTANTETARNGQPRNIWLINCNAETTDEASFDTHGEGFGIYFVRCSVHSARSGAGSDTAAGAEDTDAFNSRSANTHFIMCSVYNNRGQAFSVEQPGCTIDTCYVYNIQLGRKAVNLSASNCAVKNSYFENVDEEGITLSSGAHDCEVKNNRFKNCCRADTSLPVISLSVGALRASINNNKFWDCPNNAIELLGSNHDTQMDDNYFNNCGQTASVPAIRVVDSLRCMVNDNKFINCERPLTMEGTSDRLIYDGNSSNTCDNGKIMVGSNNTIGANNE
jgi:hypothetical protein